ncbi:hypothetical protein GCM10007304_17950 [Rhodococcoides trifolii]|uniref:Terminase n=1 Tax=Rhodococcoides trifolii TaxID=908250 RepID=A0A917D043_9NOCA|nr:terminase family protein [Rhodococcus trifolii]GGG04241.1 hypothetical protein GCM10007304_17950 [Rhodococcus trifolii]
MSLLESGEWRKLPDREKRALRDKLAETSIKLGIPINNAIEGPLQLAQKCDPRQVPREHLIAIDKALVQLSATPGAGLMVFAPPQSGKSTIISRWFPFWLLTRNPTDRIVLCSYAASLAQGHGAACRDFVEDYGAPYGLQLKRDENTRAEWTTTAGGGMLSKGVRGGITGKQMNLGIIDDPYADRAQADSPVIRKAVSEWYSSAFTTRKHPEAREIMTMTRWHKDDLAGERLELDGTIDEGGKWIVLYLPAVAVQPDPDRNIHPDSLGRPIGTPLSHPQIPENDHDALNRHWSGRKASVSTRDWNSLFQCSPFGTQGVLLSKDMIRDRTGIPGPARRTGVGIDPSGGGRDTAGIIGGHLDTSGRFWWTHSRTARMSSDKWSREACLLAHEIDADRIVYENNYGGDQAGTLIKQAWLALQHETNPDTGESYIPRGALCPMVTGVASRKSKFLRAEPIAQAVNTGRAWFGPALELNELKSEFEMWEPGSEWSPGALDAGVHLAYELLPAVASGAKVVSVAGKRKDEVQRATGVAARRITR